jgi:hypothetical protein
MALVVPMRCRKQVVPLLQAAGWDDEPHSIAEQRTDGRIIPKEDMAHLPPEQTAASILEKEQRIADVMGAHPEAARPERRLLTTGRRLALRGKISETVIRKSSRSVPLRIRSTVSSIFSAASSLLCVLSATPAIPRWNRSMR